VLAFFLPNFLTDKNNGKEGRSCLPTGNFLDFQSFCFVYLFLLWLMTFRTFQIWLFWWKEYQFKLLSWSAHFYEFLTWSWSWIFIPALAKPCGSWYSLATLFYYIIHNILDSGGGEVEGECCIRHWEFSWFLILLLILISIFFLSLKSWLFSEVNFRGLLNYFYYFVLKWSITLERYAYRFLFILFKKWTYAICQEILYYKQTKW
jgi:hypothetical protein